MPDRTPGPFDHEFEAGYVPMDAPPGIEEREYAAWKAAGGQVTRPDLARARTDTRNLDDLLSWLEYGSTSGYKAARCSESQEHHWAGLLRQLIASRNDLMALLEEAGQCIKSMMGGHYELQARIAAAIRKAKGEKS